MIRVRARTNLAAFRRSLSDAHRKQIPYALATAVTDMAQRAKADIQASMRSTFDHPKPYTLNAVFATKATKASPRAVVGLKDGATGGGTPAWKYLGPEIDGGRRARKRFEIRLGVAGYALPGPGAQLDESGDVSRSQIGRIIAALDAADSPAPSSASVSKRGPKKAYRGARGSRPAYFLGRSKKTGTPTAVYQVVGRGEIRPVLYFDQSAPTYTARWRLPEVVMESLDRSRVDAFERAWSQAIATARR